MDDKPARGEAAETGNRAAPRRDILVLGAQAAVGVGIAAGLWPFLAQMGPNPGTKRSDIKSVDLSMIPEGETRLVSWKGQPIYVRHRSLPEIERARAVSPQERRDPYARNDVLDGKVLASDDNRTFPGEARWLVVGGACTHLGCLLHSRPPDERLADGIGWQCFCHASRFDLSGRVLDGPATQNLPVPPYSIRGHQLDIGAKRA